VNPRARTLCGFLAALALILGGTVVVSQLQRVAAPWHSGAGLLSYDYDAAANVVPAARSAGNEHTTPAINNAGPRTATMAARPVTAGRPGSSTTPIPRSRAAEDGLVNLASEERTTHILYGDATGGGHLYPGLPGKTPFPSDWSPAQVMHQISDVATDPASSVVGQQGARTVLEGTRGGVNIRVVTNGSDIITGYPTNLPRNP
jgi:filamentous hemagglutinin